MTVPAEVAILLKKHGENPEIAYQLARWMCAFGVLMGTCLTLSVLIIAGVL